MYNFSHIISLINNFLYKEKINFTLKKNDIIVSQFDKYDYETKFLFLIKNKISILKINELITIINKNNTDIKAILINNYYINFIIDSTYIYKLIKNYMTHLSEIKNYYYNKSIDIEIISANPTGFLHIGHIRNAVVGKIIGSIYSALGGKVLYTYYVNNYGMQINTLGESVYYKYIKNFNVECNLFDINSLYKSQDIKSCSDYIIKKYKNKYIEYNSIEKYKEIKSEIEEISWKYFFDEIKKEIEDMKIFNINYYYENKFIHKSSDLVKELTKNYLKNKSNYVYEKDQAIWLATSKYFDDKDRVIKKSNGFYTYFISDIFYHYWRYKKKSFKYIDIWGADHHGYINRIRSALSIYNKNDIEKWSFIILQMVKIFKNNKELKMSKRAGTNINYKYLKQEIGYDAIVYFLASQSPNKSLILNVENIKLQNKNNPLYYFNYGFVRLWKIKNKCKDIKKHSLNDININIDGINKKIILILYQIKDVLINVCKQSNTFLFIKHCNDFAKLVHKFYEFENILYLKDDKYKSLKIIIVDLLINHYLFLYKILTIKEIYAM